MKLLLVEDNRTTCDSLSELLTRDGHSVEATVNGMAAIAMMAHHKIDAIICDYIMPGMNGLDFIIQVRKDDEWKSIPVILITAIANPERLDTEVDEIRKSGPVITLRKPFDPERLLLLLSGVALRLM